MTVEELILAIVHGEGFECTPYLQIGEMYTSRDIEVVVWRGSDMKGLHRQVSPTLKEALIATILAIKGKIPGVVQIGKVDQACIEGWWFEVDADFSLDELKLIAKYARQDEG